MRLALLVHAATTLGPHLDARLARAGRGLPDLGFSVVEARARDERALGIERALSGVKKGETVLVAIDGRVVLGPTGSPAIEAGSRDVRVDDLFAAVASCGAGEALLLVDGVFDPPEDDPLASAEAAAAIVHEVGAQAPWLSALVALRTTQHAGGDATSPTSAPLLELVVEAARGVARGQGGSAQLSEVFEQMREDGGIYTAVAAFAHARGATDFALARPVARPFEALPGVDEHFAEAEAKIAAGDLDAALDACKRVLLLAGDDKARRAEVFVRIAAIKQRQGRGREAVFNLEKALSIAPTHRTALEGLILVATHEARWADVAALGQRLVAAIEAPHERFQALFDLGRVFHDTARDLPRATALLEQAAPLAPRDEELLRRLVELYDHQKRFADLAPTLVRYAEATDHAFQQASRLGAAARVYWRALGDVGRAVELYDRALVARNDDPALFGELAELLEQAGQLTIALRARQRAALSTPRHADTHHAVFRIASKLGRNDLAFSAATVLAHLGQADIDEDLLADQHRPEGLLRAARPLAPAAWRDHLAPADGHAVLTIFEAIDEAALRARVAELRDGERLAAFDPSTRQDPATSTLSAVRAFAFAGQLLGVPLPDLHLVAEAPGGVAAAPAERATTVVGKQILSGRSLPELTFLMARHLAYHRPGARVALYYPSFAELSTLLLAAVQLVRPAADVGAAAPQVARLRDRLAPLLDTIARDRLDLAVQNLERDGGRPDLVLWLRTLERTATRAGLLACGDAAVAARLVEHDPAPVGDLSAQSRVDDLLSFCISDAHEALRRDLGVTIA